MKAAVALLVSLSMLGCFPNNPRARTYAKWVEGGMVVTGIAISAVANTGADCDEMVMPGPNVDNDCRTTAKWLSTAGVALILGGLLGFVATISTAEDEEVQKKLEEAQKNPVKTEPKDVKLPPGVNPQPTDGQPTDGTQPPVDPATGSASQDPAAPPS